MYKLPENEELLFNYLSGCASDREKQAIYEWINQSGENKAYFNKVKADYILMVEASRANLISKNDVTSLLDRIKRRRRTRMTIAAAVSFSFVLFFSITLSFNYFNPKPPDSISEVQPEPVQIRPGSNAAILQLSTGEQIDVKNVGNQIVDGSGTKIKIDESGKISYHANKAGKRNQSVVANKRAAHDQSAFGASVEIKYNKLIIPRGGEYMIKLADGTQVWLNSASELRYPVEFTGSARTVYLKGEAYFNVAHDKAHPFVVCVDKVSLKVLGTSFNVNTQSAGIVETVLVEGRVEVNGNGAKAILKPNERGIVKEGGKAIAVDAVDVKPFVAWKNGDFVFHGESLGAIMNKLSLWYNVDVNFKSEAVKQIKLSGEMTRSSQIGDILYFFEKASNVKFAIKEGAITVYQAK
ncbi:MAG: FecR domain-containing protein [Bacteroidales bacterium]